MVEAIQTYGCFLVKEKKKCATVLCSLTHSLTHSLAHPHTHSLTHTHTHTNTLARALAGSNAAAPAGTVPAAGAEGSPAGRSAHDPVLPDRPQRAPASSLPAAGAAALTLLGHQERCSTNEADSAVV